MTPGMNWLDLNMEKKPLFGIIKSRIPTPKELGKIFLGKILLGTVVLSMPIIITVKSITLFMQISPISIQTKKATKEP